MSRKYTVISRSGRNADSTAAFGDPEPALEHFENMLHASGHSDPAVREHLKTLTLVLMQGGQGYTVMDPDLNGSMEITISTSGYTTRKE